MWRHKSRRGKKAKDKNVFPPLGMKKKNSRKEGKYDWGIFKMLLEI